MTRKKPEALHSQAPRRNSSYSANRTIILLLLALLCTGLGLPEHMDKTLFLSLNAYLNVLPAPVWINVTNLGSTAAGAALLCLILPKKPQVLLSLVISGLLCTLMIYTFKHTLDLVRPHLLLDRTLFYFIETDIGSPARPSGHSATGFFIAGCVWRLSESGSAKIIALVMATLIALSRIAIGVHWPLDLVWGAFAGLGVGYYAPALVSLRYRSRHLEGVQTELFLNAAVVVILAVYFVFRPLPYHGQNLPSYLIIYAALGISMLRSFGLFIQGRRDDQG